MKVAVVYQYYQSDLAPGHSLIYDWTQYLAQQGHEVTVIAGESGYMEREKPTLPWYKRIIRKEQVGKVHVRRTYTYPELHRNYFDKLLSFISFSLSCPLGLFSITKPDLVIGSSPPIFPIFSAWLICKLRRIPFVMEVRDLWPESAIQMGVLKNKPLIKIMTWMEGVLYDKSYKIIALTKGIQNNICSRGWPKDKVIFISCGVDLSKLYPDESGATFIRERYYLQHKKIVLYFGALGEANNIPVILRAAERLQGLSDIVFVLIGDGMQGKVIEQKIMDMKLNNILLHKPVPKDQARLYINAADVCIVTLLNIPLFAGALPTKLFDYMACGKPVLCGVDGEAKVIIDESRAGFSFAPDDDEHLANLIIHVLRDENALEMGQNGIEYVKNNYPSSKMHGIIEEIIFNSGRL